MNEKLDLGRDHVRADFFLRAEPAHGQALEDMEQAEIAKALPQSESQKKTSIASERDSLPIATGVESGNDGLHQASEVIELAQNPGEEKARAETGANIGMTAVETISDRAATIDRYQGDVLSLEHTPD